MIIVRDSEGRTAHYPSATRMEVDPSGALVLRNENRILVAIWAPGSYKYAEPTHARDNGR